MSKPLAFVVEDNPDLAMVYEDALKEAGFEVEVIDNGARAIDRLAEVAPALIILDLNLPHVSGENTLRQVRDETSKGGPLANTRVMVVSADVSRAELLRDQADLVLSKPVTYTQMIELAQRLVPASKRFAQSDAPSDADTQPGAEPSPDEEKEESEPPAEAAKEEIAEPPEEAVEQEPAKSPQETAAKAPEDAPEQTAAEGRKDAAKAAVNEEKADSPKEPPKTAAKQSAKARAAGQLEKAAKATNKKKAAKSAPKAAAKDALKEDLKAKKTDTAKDASAG